MSLGECCHNKLVGGRNYNLIGEATEKELQVYGCNSPCVYNLEGDRQQQFCFRPGTMESKCLTTSKSTTKNGNRSFKLLPFIQPNIQPLCLSPSEMPLTGKFLSSHCAVTVRDV